MFQSDGLSLTTALDELDATLGYLQQLSTSPGHVYSKLLTEFDDPKQPTKFRGIDVVGDRREMDLCNRDANVLTTKAVAYLEGRFRVVGVIKDFEIFNPCNWPLGADRNKMAAYGNEELSRIVIHFQLLISLRKYTNNGFD